MPVKEVNKSEEVRKLHKSGVKKGSEIVEKLKSEASTSHQVRCIKFLPEKRQEEIKEEIGKSF